MDIIDISPSYKKLFILAGKVMQYPDQNTTLVLSFYSRLTGAFLWKLDNEAQSRVSRPWRISLFNLTNFHFFKLQFRFLVKNFQFFL